MIESAEIRQFRGFQFVQLSGLSRINVIVGDNGAGKTAILEALFMAAANSPDIALRLKAWRGADAQSLAGSSQEIYDSLFLELFHKFDKAVRPTVVVSGNKDSARTLQFYYDTVAPTLLPFSGTGTPSASGSGLPQAYTPVTFEWQSGKGEPLTVTPKISPNGIIIPPAPILNHDPAFLAARTQFPTSQNARWFSEFSKRGRESTIVNALKAQFEFIETLTVEVDMGNPVIFVKMPWFEQKVPLYLTSDGMNKLLTLLLHIAHSQGTALFVDEIENGFHFSRHARLWEQLLSFADQYETQLFLTTHSWEFLVAAVPLIKKFPDDFTMVQVAQENGVGRAVVVPGKRAAAAIENEIEVRGHGRRGPSSH